MQWRRLPWEVRYHYGPRLTGHVRRLVLQASHLHCTVEFQGPVRLGPNFSLDIPGKGSFIVGPGVDFRRGFHCEIQGDGLVKIGAGSIFTAYGLIQCSTSIEIGKRAVFAQGVLIADGNHRFGDFDRHVLDQGYDFNPIRVGDGAMVLSKSTILADVGAHAIVGANSVVTRDVPPFCLAVGAPARVVRYFGPPERRPVGIDGDVPN